MLVLADSTAWVGVAGTTIGILITSIGAWLVRRSERAERISERSRTERKDAYAALLTGAENSMHHFQRLAREEYTPAGAENDRASADMFYDDEVVPRYRVLKIIGPTTVVAGARNMRMALNDIRHAVVDREPPLTAKSTDFQRLHDRYRAARTEFTKLARSDLSEVVRKRGTDFRWPKAP
jgi:hypothetical protein